MKRRILASAFVLAVLGAVTLMSLAPLRAQAPAAPARPAAKAAAKAPAKSPWKAPHTPWGDPDIQGAWNNGTITPLERPNGSGQKDLLSDEVTTIIVLLEATRADRRPTDAVADLELAYNQEWWDRGKSIGRASLIIDPPDGRLPPLTAEGQRRREAREKERRSRGPADSVADRPFHERCLIYRSVPPLPTGYNNNYRILQSPGVIAILQEQIHDTRFIYLDGRPHLGGRIRQWLGDSRGHWEGDTLVIETTNFDPHIDFFKFQIASETLKVTERIKRTGPDNLDYRWTVDDPTTYTRQWTAVLPLRTEPGPLYEYACHEGNRGLVNVMTGFRAQERKAEQAAKTAQTGSK
jgi:hypothetical protein